MEKYEAFFKELTELSLKWWRIRNMCALKIAVADYPNNVYAKEIWNEAIELAARCVHNTIDAEQIRKLKK